MTGMSIDLTGQVALVTGGGAGIGQGCALALSSCGADVVVAEIDPDRGAHTAALIEASGRRAVFVQTDVMDTEQVRAAVAVADREFGRLDILVNNAGGVAGRRFLDQSERSWRRHIDINLVSMLAATHSAVPLMIRGGRGGSVVNVASIEAVRAAPTYAVYAACKAGMVNFTKTFALEVSEHDIRVNCIAPDLTATPGLHGMAAGVASERLPERSASARAAIGRYIPLGREGVIDECGQVVAFLCSPLASYVTGVTIPVDGGTAAASGWVRTADGSGWDFGVGTIAP
jgi:NAD(P)-dependent dehydrogenase (short-subunit alcohol dehydrogenase family)